MRFLQTKDACAYLREKWGVGFSRSTLTTLACRGGGPRFRKLSRFRVYTPEDLDKWALARLSGPVDTATEAKALRAERGEAA